MIYRGYVVRWSGASSTFGIVQQKYPDKLCQYVLNYRAACHRDIDEVKGCVSLDPSKISKSGWWGLQLDTWQLCNSLWYGLINSKLHINKKIFFFISHNIRRCHTSNVLNHPADLSGMDLTSDPSWFTHSPGKASTKRYSPQIFKGSLLFSLSTANKMKQILCVICFDTKWLSVLFKTVIIQSDDHNVPHYAYKTTAHV